MKQTAAAFSNVKYQSQKPPGINFNLTETNHPRYPLEDELGPANVVNDPPVFLIKTHLIIVYQINKLIDTKTTWKSSKHTRNLC